MFTETLYELGRELCTASDKRRLIVCDAVPGHMDEVVQFARVKLAVDFYRKGNLFCFRAMAEGWDQRRVVREVYA